jgi:hypothetical protein
MNCQNHPEVPAAAYCRTCGKALCEACRRDAYGTVFCDEHVPAPSAAPPPPLMPYPGYPGAGPRPQSASPGLAFVLGLIPGVGAIYNGQYAKGLVHAVIFGLFVSILEGGAGGLEPLFGLMLTAFIAYMAFEAYHTALRRRAGEPVDEFSSIINLHGQTGFPAAAILLIALGTLLLLNTLDLLDFRYIARYWPVLLIALGAWLLVNRASSRSGEEVRHERR